MSYAVGHCSINKLNILVILYYYWAFGFKFITLTKPYMPDCRMITASYHHFWIKVFWNLIKICVTEPTECTLYQLHTKRTIFSAGAKFYQHFKETFRMRNISQIAYGHWPTKSIIHSVIECKNIQYCTTASEYITFTRQVKRKPYLITYQINDKWIGNHSFNSRKSVLASQ